ncbi:MAG: NUDIX domain-containing protein [Planctomycetales bacterium]|nr:NUDIX domain-containing protein [Planctomycetales bacterium]
MTKSDKSPTTRAAGILLVTRTEPRQFLLMRHIDRWDLPKGHCDRGETDLQTALRETEEETGIPSESITIDPDFRFQLSYPTTYKRYGDQVFQKTVVYFLGEIESAVTPTLTEHQAFHWFAWEPPHEIQTQTIDPLLEAVANHYHKNRIA